MVRHESIITALLGTTPGIAVGSGVAEVPAAVLAGRGPRVPRSPSGSLVAFIGRGHPRRDLTAILPARRATRMNVLSALKYSSDPSTVGITPTALVGLAAQ